MTNIVTIEELKSCFLCGGAFEILGKEGKLEFLANYHASGHSIDNVCAPDWSVRWKNTIYFGDHATRHKVREHAAFWE